MENDPSALGDDRHEKGVQDVYTSRVCVANSRGIRKRMRK